jgi:hypothetical protein
MMVSRVGAEFVVAAPNVLHERVTTDDHAGGVVAFESAHRAKAYGCRKLVWTADLRLCPSGHRVIELRNCAIHPESPVALVPVTSPERLTGGPGNKPFSRYSRLRQ